ncbi:MAG: glycerol-3-phosphate dehydrogenase/oxidase [Anaerolineae bacterium]|jgi:glycerol-3-phosphate dehydrogenase
MWHTGWRDEIWKQLQSDAPWDVLVIGGGITGAGILREATRLGLRTLLVESRDFGWGTSSRSSKLVHGGLRYLRNLQIGLMRASVRERERLLEEGPGLIDPLGFLLATYEGDRPPGWVFEAGLTVYDLLALRWSHRQYDAHDFQLLAPHIATQGLQGGFRYGDAQTDDARLVLRLIREAVRAGGMALNYTAAQSLLRDDETNHVNGAILQDTSNPLPLRSGDYNPQYPRPNLQIHARVVINATGAWADRLRQQVGGKTRIRPLRGSHLIFPAWKLPVAQAVSFLHPHDRRPVFIFPWEGITLVGTTDVDHAQPLDEEPGIELAEFAYLMAAVNAQFASLNLKADDVLATFAGVRPVVDTGKADPSRESRDHVLWEESGLLTVTGGKLTTFRLIALDALKAARRALPDVPQVDKRLPVLDPVDVELPGDALDEEMRHRLLGRYGADAPALVAAAGAGELERIPGTKTLWAELRWAARDEGVVHLDDLLLRRVRLGLLTSEGAWPIIGRIRAIVQPELGWDDARWEAEAERYRELWRRYYGVPEGADAALVALTRRTEPQVEVRQTRSPRRLYLGLASLLTLGLLLWQRRTKR